PSRISILLMSDRPQLKVSPLILLISSPAASLQAAQVVVSVISSVWLQQQEQDWSAKERVADEVTRHNDVMRLAVNVFEETLGPSAAEAAVLLEDVLKARLDLLMHLARWVWRRLTPRLRV